MKFLCKTVTETLNDARLAGPRGTTKILLDRLLTTVSTQGGIRNPTTNRVYRIQKTMFHDVNVTTGNRVNTLFLLPHDIGHQAQLFHEDVRTHVLCMIAPAQLMIITCRGHRSYTEDELRSVYEEGFIVFSSKWNCCERAQIVLVLLSQLLVLLTLLLPRFLALLVLLSIFFAYRCCYYLAARCHCYF